MIHIYKEANYCDLVIKNSFDEFYKDTIEEIFADLDKALRVYCSGIYILPAWFLKSTSSAIKRGKIIHIEVDKMRLSAYLHRLGFDVSLKHDKKRFLDISLKSNVVVFGGSAGSSRIFMELIARVDIRALAIVIVQHVLYDCKPQFDKILSHYTDHPVSYAIEGEKIERGHIYIAPQGMHLIVEDFKFKLDDSHKINLSKPSISKTFLSFADLYREKLLVILSCGYLNDGVDALKTARGLGATIVIEDPQDCKAKSIPLSAIETREYHMIFKRDQIARYINFVSIEFDEFREWVAYVIDSVEDIYGYDFKDYDFGYMLRRVKVFMKLYSVSNAKLMAYMVLFNEEIFRDFFIVVSVNVTEFFRDIDDYIFLSDLLRDFKYRASIRVWSAACSVGEEAYSVAMLLDELGLLKRSLIYATDYNKSVLDEAKNGLFSKDEFKILKNRYEVLPFSGAIDRYICEYDRFIEISSKLKQKVLLFEHNLQKDTVFNEFDFVVCKNVLIYFQPKLQEKVLLLLYNSLKFGGYLLLGRSEIVIGDLKDKFNIIDDRYKIYKKIA